MRSSFCIASKHQEKKLIIEEKKGYNLFRNMCWCQYLYYCFIVLQISQIILCVIYNTIKEASESLNISRSVVKYRLNTKTEKFKNWFKIK